MECLVVVFFFFFRMGVYNGLIKSILECSFVIHDNATPIWLQWFVGMDENCLPKAKYRISSLYELLGF